MQQQLPDLGVHHIVESTRLLKDLQSLPGYLRFEPTASDLAGMELLTFVDASHHSNAAYGQTGFICLLALANKDATVLPLHWVSKRQRRVSTSSYGAEILAAESGCALSLRLLSGLELLFGANLPCKLATDSRGLWTALQSLEKPVSFRMRASTSAIRDHVERNRLAAILWIPGKDNLADSLTRRSRFALLQTVVSHNRLPTELASHLDQAEKQLV
jgi:hypothetical protein